MTTYKDPGDNVYSNHEAYTGINVEGANNKFINDCANIFYCMMMYNFIMSLKI